MTWDLEQDGDDVVVVTMHGTPANCQNERFYRDLHEALDALEAEFPQCAVVLTAEGAVFSAGLDLPYVAALFQTGDRDELWAWQERYVATNFRLFEFARPLVAAVNGHAFAGGLITALCADFRIGAAGSARFALNEVPIGIPMPTTYLELIACAIGWPTTARLSLTGVELDVEEACRTDLLHEVVEPARLRASAVAHAARMARSLPAFTQTKRALRAPVLARMRGAAYAADRACIDVLCSPESRAVMAQRLELFGKGDQ